MRTTKAFLIISIILIISFIFHGCKTVDTSQFEERIRELETKLEEAEEELAPEEVAEEKEEEEEEASEEEVTTYILKSQIEQNMQREQVAEGKAVVPSDKEDTSKKKKPVRKAQDIKRNDPCPCGSGKKYKQCHGAEQE